MPPNLTVLQWSHNNSVVETVFFVPAAGQETLASMEPQQFSCGNTASSSVQYSQGYASMEPQQFSCGNTMARISSTLTTVSFNGATTIQLWKPIRQAPRRSIISSLQWSHNNSVVETIRNCIIPFPVYQASMEPQQFSCGNSDRKKSHCGDVANGLFSRTK